MSQPLKCPQCGASEANLLQDNIYQCKFCGSIYEYGDVKSAYDTTTTVKTQKPVSYDTVNAPEAAQKISRIIFITVALVIFGIAASVIFSVSKTMSSKSTASSSSPATATSKDLYKDDNESNSCFAVVNTANGPQVWTVSRRNSDGLKEVDYFLNRVDTKENKIIDSKQIGNTISWEQSFKEEYRMEQLKPMGKICWLIYGEKLSGYDVNTGEEIINSETLRRQFPELKNGVAKVEDVYDMDGFKLTTKDGFVYYYAATQAKLFSEKEYEDKDNSANNLTNKTEFCFTDGDRQKLYKIDRKVSGLFDNKISSNTLTDLVKEKDGWYKRTYKVNSIEEFAPNEIYFKAAVLYYDSAKLVIIYQKELGENSPIVIKCLDVNKKELWSKTNAEAALFKPFLKSTNAENFLHENQLTLIQPYQLAVCLNIENGNIDWSFKPY